MVLQRDRVVAFWGSDNAGQSVSVTFRGKTARTTASASGAWRLNLPSGPAGGPFAISVEGSSRRELTDVLVGDLWVCSGQSNMDWPVSLSYQPQREISAAHFPMIRTYRVPYVSTEDVQSEAGGTWQTIRPDSVAGITAVGYYFARTLWHATKVPIGIIHTAWGGTPVESWTPRPVLAANPASKDPFGRYLESQRDFAARYRAYRTEWMKWLEEVHPGVYANKGYGQGFASPAENPGWRPLPNETNFVAAVGTDAFGSIWFRTIVEVPASAAGKPAVLDLGPVDDYDQTYVNGVQVGAMGPETDAAWSHPRRYTVPANAMKGGPTVVSIRVYNNSGFGGIPRARREIQLVPEGGPAIPLDGKWEARVEDVNGTSGAPRPPEPQAPLGPGNPWSPGSLYNAMIHPLIQFPVRGAIWYQGESNAWAALRYQSLFPAMIQSWRDAWRDPNMPFYFVQLANFRARGQGDGWDSQWAELREAQTMTLKLPKTGMALSIDIGDPVDIHPRNKQEVGGRLARWALRDVFGQSTEVSGPVYAGMKADGNKIIVRFKNANGLKLVGPRAKAFAVAGADRKWLAAQVRVEGETVVVWADGVPAPVAVRYAWRDDPDSPLLNGAGLPAVPFRSDDWPRLTEKG